MWGIFFLDGIQCPCVDQQVQQVVAIFVLSQEEMSTGPSTLPFELKMTYLI